MRVTGGASNLVNGVSRQSPDVRLTTQLEESINQWPTVTRGLVPRNPAMRVSGLPSFRPNTLKQFIERDQTERYLTEIGSEGVRVWDLAGNAKTVFSPSGWDYLAGADKDDIQAVSVADHTFILNRRKTVLEAPDTTAPSKSNALVHVIQGAYHTDYRIRIDGALAAHFQTYGGPYENNDLARLAEAAVKQDSIARALSDGALADGTATSVTDGWTFHSNLRDTLDPAVWSITRIDNVIHIQNRLGNDFVITATADAPNLVRVFKGTAPVYADLPSRAPNGFSLRVNGDESSEHDDYYVVFQKDAGVGEGSWKETVAPGTKYRMDAATMPHILVRNSNGTFTFKPATWASRTVGDEDTNPWPSFVGKPLAGIVYAQNRLGMYAGESIALSCHNSPFDFFKESLLARLDTDPVDLSIAHTEVSNIRQAVPMGDEIVLFTSSIQFRLSADGQRLTNDNGSIKPILSTKAISRAAPVTLGTQLYFVNDAASGSFMHEFEYDRDGGRKFEEDISAHVQGYLPSEVDILCGDGTLLTLALVGRDRPADIVTYRWKRAGTERVMSAWQTWNIPTVTAVHALAVIDESLYIAAEVEGGAEVLAINLHEGWKQGYRSAVYLDRQVLVTGSYSDTTLSTTFQVSVSGASSAVSVDPETFGAPVAAVWEPDGSSFTIAGDWSDTTLAVGVPFESYGILSPLLYRSQSRDGAYGNAVPGVETRVSALAFGSGNTAFLEVEVLRRYREPYRIVLTPAQMSTETGFVGAQQIGRATGTVSVMARSDDVKIRFGISSPHPYEITGMTWSGSATPRVP